MPNTYAYIRYSTDKQTNSLECQWDHIQKRAEHLDMTIDLTRRYVDKAQSGSIKFHLRPQAKALLDVIQEGDTLIVTALDRIGRNLRDLLRVIDGLVEHQVNIHVINFAGISLDMKSAVGRLLVQLLGAVAEFERNLIIERTKNAIETRKAAGLQFNRWKPPGREDSGRKNKNGETLYVYSQSEWDLMAEVYRRHDIEGETWWSIGRDFERRGIRTNNGGLWVRFRKGHDANLVPMQTRCNIYREWLKTNEGKPLECKDGMVFVPHTGPVRPNDVPVITRKPANGKSYSLLSSGQ